MPPLNMTKTWEFKPSPNVKVGSLLTGGDTFGTVFENDLFDTHCIMVHPKGKGRVTYIAAPGMYSLNDKILELEHDGKKTEYTMI